LSLICNFYYRYILNILHINVRLFINFFRSGEGVYNYADGGRFEGDFDGDEKIKGTLFYANGDKYIGEFRNDCKSGRGTYYYSKNS
jgi:hypothetical protein